MYNHTTGPWRWSDQYLTADGRETWSLLGEDGFGILSCDGKGNSPQEVRPGGAVLLESAPELFELLVKLSDLTFGTEDKIGILAVSDPYCGFELDAQPIKKRVFELLNKVKGE